MTTTIANSNHSVEWPDKKELFGVGVSPVTCAQACTAIIGAAQSGHSAVVSAFSVHALVEAGTCPELMDRVNRFAIIVPDGQPVRWALNWVYDSRLDQNVRGADLMWRLCQEASLAGVAIYLYGGTNSTLAALTANLRKAFPALLIAGAEAPPFRRLSANEAASMIERLNASGARLAFIGLGCPKQDYFASDYMDHLRLVQVCVGAAFDFHAGAKAMAPIWMQRSGLEWVFRLGQEPRRLWKRYLVTNTIFIVKLLAQLTRDRFSRRRTGDADGSRQTFLKTQRRPTPRQRSTMSKER